LITAPKVIFIKSVYCGLPATTSLLENDALVDIEAAMMKAGIKVVDKTLRDKLKT
jgi:hypothetical protein